MCVIVCDPEDGYMNYELEMKQMFHKVAPFILYISNLGPGLGPFLLPTDEIKRSETWLLGTKTIL